jgi:hypothetical protein
MAEVFDLDALIREREQQPFRFRFGGDDYEFPPSVDLRLAKTIEQLPKAGVGGMVDLLRDLLGPDQWARLEASESVFDLVTFMALLDRYGEHLGSSMGESVASSSSSKPSAKRSRPTSSVRTISA